MRRILVYSHDTYGLGNIRRMLAICEHLCTVHPDVSILIVSGSPMLHAFRLAPRIDYIKLPCLTRTGSGDYEVRSLGLSYEATIRMRRQMLMSAMSAFAPDLVLVDKKPFGVDEELRPAIEDAASWRTPPAFALMLRDILDEPATTIPIWRKNRYYEAIEAYFDAVLVLGSQEVFDLPTEYRFPPTLTTRVEFCGYLRRSPTPGAGTEAGRPPVEGDGRARVLVTPGGGADGAHLIDAFRAALVSTRWPRVASTVVAGPEMPDAATQDLHALALGRDDLHVLHFTDDLPSHIAAADLVVSMAGYNTVCEILSADRRAVLVPRVRPVKEQLIRAHLLAGRGIVDMIHPDALTPDALLGAIDTNLEATHDHQGDLDLGGLERVEKHVAGLLGDG